MKQSFQVDLAFEAKTAGGQHRYFTVPEQKDTAGVRNVYITKNAFPPGVTPDRIKLTVEFDDGK